MYISVQLRIIPLIGTQDEKIVDSKDEEKIVGSYLRFKRVISDSL
jgi:hypothetical protein